MSFPRVDTALPVVPAVAAAQANRGLDLLARDVVQVDNRLASSRGEGGAGFVENAILGPMPNNSAAVLDRIAIAINRAGAVRPTCRASPPARSIRPAEPAGRP